MNKVIGIDLGFGGMKIALGSGLRVRVPMQAARVTTALGDLSLLGAKTGKRPPVVANGRGSFYVGDGAHRLGRVVSRLDYERLAGDPELNAVLGLALHNAGIEHGSTVDAVIGLPFGAVQSGKKLVADAKAFVGGLHEWQIDGEPYHITIDSVLGFSQAQAALVDVTRDDNGRVIAGVVSGDDLVGVVSVGYNTIELSAFRGDEMVPALTSYAKSGVRRLLEIAAAATGAPLAELDESLRAGTLLSRLPGGAFETWKAEVSGVIENAWSDQVRRMARVIAVGGGSIIAEDTLRSILNGRVDFTSDRMFAIASGLRKVGMAAARKRSSK